MGKIDLSGVFWLAVASVGMLLGTSVTFITAVVFELLGKELSALTGIAITLGCMAVVLGFVWINSK